MHSLPDEIWFGCDRTANVICKLSRKYPESTQRVSIDYAEVHTVHLVDKTVNLDNNNIGQ